MKLTCDPRRSLAYLRLHEKTAEVETVRISDKLCIDLAPDGTVYASSFSTPTQNFVAPTAGDSCS